VQTRDGTCRMWGCNRRASRADLDHTRPWPDGPTSPRGLATLCRRHHRMKQLGRWRYTLHDDGDITWTGSTGRMRRTHPAHRVIQPPTTTESARYPRQNRPPQKFDTSISSVAPTRRLESGGSSQSESDLVPTGRVPVDQRPPF
ncbi:MAG: HNH endonuclease signature motif containing protein, partial [Dermatophilaceae bacterium]